MYGSLNLSLLTCKLKFALRSNSNDSACQCPSRGLYLYNLSSGIPTGIEGCYFVRNSTKAREPYGPMVSYISAR